MWQLLGTALANQGKDALEAMAMAVQCLPTDGVALLNLGNALGRAGRIEEAASAYRRALLVQPEFAEAHNNLGDVQLELGQLAEALASLRRAVAIRPDFAQAHANLGKVLRRLGQFEQAQLSCRRAIELKPDWADAHNCLGTALMSLARIDEALVSFASALAIDADFAEAHANRADALRSVGRLDEAVAGYHRALASAPQAAPVYTELATALRLQCRTEDAEAACRQALQIDPSAAKPLTVLAELRADAGDFAQAQELFRRAAGVDPDCIEACAGLARVQRMTSKDDAWLANAQGLVAQALPPGRELLLRYALGKYFDDISDYDRAFGNFERANRLAKACGPAHDRTTLTRNIELIMRSHSGAWLGRKTRAVDASIRPIFIVGMLRSGTSLAEQILASHPAVFGAGELTFWSSQLAAQVGAARRTGMADVQPSAERLAQLAGEYQGQLRRLCPDRTVVVDKLPTNFLALGLIHAALPQARFIHMRRNPLDTCLSIFFQHFEAANTYANDLGDMAHYYGEYQRLMQHWRDQLPATAILDVPYESLVQDLPRWTAAMLEFIGVPWDSRCLEFHRTVRTVVTASKWQVRQQINASSVGRWRNYQKHLGSLLSLAPPDSR